MLGLLKKIKIITWMRWAAAGVLTFLTYWVFSDLNINLDLFKTLIPLSYLFKWQLVLPKKIIFLLLPILVNIALWAPCYCSYIFLRVVIYAERIKLYCLMVLCTIMATLGLAFMNRSGINEAFNTLVVYIFIVGVMLYWNMAMLSNLKQEEVKRYFKVESISEKELKALTRSMLIVFVVCVYFIYFY